MSDSRDKLGDNLPFDALDLAPAWAQGPRTPTRANNETTDDVSDRRSRPSHRLRNSSRRPSNDGFAHREKRRPRSREDTPSTPHQRNHDPRLSGTSSRRHQPREISILPITVHFIPARHGMESLARRLAESRRAFPLGKLTALFLDRLDSLVVRLSPDLQSSGDGADGTSPLTLFQCRLCRTVYLDREPLIQHMLTQHLDRFYRVHESENEPPNGNFVCVARCGLSGELIGPPNYHGYHERLTTLHRERYPHLSFEAYRSKLDMIRDPEVIEAWKQSMRKQTVYFPVSQTGNPSSIPEPDAETTASTDPAPVTGQDGLAGFNEVKQHFLQHVYPDTALECISCVIPGTVAREIEDENLRRWIESAWRRESRSIMRTAITIRGIFRSLGFSAFKTADQRVFMTAVAPNPLQDAETVDTIKSIIDYVDNHPGCTRAALWEDLGFGDDRTAGTAVDRHFRLLIDKGRLIFFHDGTLTLPHHLHAIRGPTTAKKPKRKKSRTPKKKLKS